MKTHELLAALDQAVREAAPQELPAVLGRLVEAEEHARLRLRAAPVAVVPTSAEPAGPEPICLSIVDAAALLNVSEDYMAKLARQHKVPTVRLPALTRGKAGAQRTPEARTLRIPYEALRAMIAARTEKALDTPYSTVLYRSHERARGPNDSRAVTAHPGRARQARRRALDDCEPVGTGDGERPGAHGETAPHPRGLAR